MERQYEYFAIVTDARPLLEEPWLVCRRWVDGSGQAHDEAFTMQLVWERSTALSLAESGVGEAHRVDAAAAARFEQLQRYRELRMEPEDGRYSYFAWVDDGSLDDPDAVFRSWTSSQGYDLEQQYTAGFGWKSSDIRDDWHRGRKDGKLVPIDSDAVERFKQRAEQG